VLFVLAPASTVLRFKPGLPTLVVLDLAVGLVGLGLGFLTDFFLVDDITLDTPGPFLPAIRPIINGAKLLIAGSLFFCAIIISKSYMSNYFNTERATA
jgi:hypothetical protein